MTRKQILLVVALVVAASSLSALVAYRRALHHFAFPYGAPSASGGGAKVGCVDFHDAASHLGEATCVSGRVLRIFTSRGDNTFLVYCSDYRTCPFTTVISSSDQSKFGNLGMLEGRRVEIEGPINSYQGRAEIIIHDPRQIRVLP